MCGHRGKGRRDQCHMCGSETVVQDLACGAAVQHWYDLFSTRTSHHVARVLAGSQQSKRLASIESGRVPNAVVHFVYKMQVCMNEP
jgi:hypothetical protein